MGITPVVNSTILQFREGHAFFKVELQNSFFNKMGAAKDLRAQPLYARFWVVQVAHLVVKRESGTKAHTPASVVRELPFVNDQWRI